MQWSRFVKNLHEDKGFTSLVEQKLNFRGQEKIFTIGSCFARNIEDVLSQEFQFPTLKYKGRKEEFSGSRTRSILNKFTPFSIIRELKWVIKGKQNFIPLTEAEFAVDLDQFGMHGVCDIGLRQLKKVSKERFFERRTEIYEIYQEIKTCDAVLITLGNLEQVFDSNGKPWEQVPTDIAINRKIKFDIEHNKSLKQVTDEVLEICNLTKNLNNKVKIILTVSPVPMRRTFSKNNIFLENFKNKSLLCQACKNINIENVFYFPSFEIISFYGVAAFEEDLRHIKSEPVVKVCDVFKKFVNI